MDAEQIGKDIVEQSRRARFADVTTEEWGRRIANLMRAEPGISDIEIANVRQVSTAAGGSNGTLLFNATYRREGAEERQDLVLRFLPASGLFHKYDVSGQFRLQRALERSKVPVPRQWWLDAEGAHLKVPGYVMEMVSGVSPPMNWKTSGLIADASPAARREMMSGYVHALAGIHAVNWQGLGLTWLEDRAAGSRPIEREANWYWDALNWVNLDDNVSKLRHVYDMLIKHEPDFTPVLCHGDANLGNYLFSDNKVVAVVDWEMAFIGAPECDVAFLRVGDEILQGHIPSPEGALTYDEIYAEYERASGRPLRHMAYFELFASYRSAVITVLAMRHFSEGMRDQFKGIVERSLNLCLKRAEDFSPG